MTIVILHYPRVRAGRRDGGSVDGLLSFATLPEFLECYALAVSAISRPADLERICYELLIDEAAQGVRWCEPMVAPQYRVPAFGSMDEVWEVMRTGFDRAAAETGIAWGAIVGHLRTHPAELAEQVASWAARHADQGVVGFGIAGDEEQVGLQPFARACAIAAEAGLLVVPHAGETAGPESVREALSCGADHLAHGVRSVENRVLLADKGVACDVCPTCTTGAGAVDHEAQNVRPRLRC